MLLRGERVIVWIHFDSFGIRKYTFSSHMLILKIKHFFFTILIFFKIITVRTFFNSLIKLFFCFLDLESTHIVKIFVHFSIVFLSLVNSLFELISQFRSDTKCLLDVEKQYWYNVDQVSYWSADHSWVCCCFSINDSHWISIM